MTRLTKFMLSAPVLLLTSMLALSSILSGCAAMVGAGATVGVAAVQERGLKGRVSDLEIEAQVLEKFVKAGFKLTSTIGAEVYEGRVLLTGASTDIKITDQAVKLVWEVDGVKAVLNEIQVGKNSGISDIAQDSWITAQVKSKMTFDEDIFSINYVVETVNGTVYLIGIAQNEAEHKRAKQHAASVKFVRNVISHVRIKNY
ncbi:MAG: BON domain-containing protein [Rhodospirillales bacterium]|nr:BON domain-containing protein [Rhodospirillales bacterium]